MPAGFIDLHCHPLPAVDDGVRTLEEGQRLLAGLQALGFSRVVATPHIREGMFANRRSSLLPVFERLRGSLAPAGLQLDLAAEHHADAGLLDALQAGEALPYPGGQALLLEMPDQRAPLKVSNLIFQLRLRGLRPVLAHPERYRWCWQQDDALPELCRFGAQPLLDLMALQGHYGREPRRAAERFLEQGHYWAACSDVHRPADLEVLAAAMQRLQHLVGEEQVRRLLFDHPAHILGPSRIFDEEASA